MPPAVPEDWLPTWATACGPVAQCFPDDENNNEKADSSATRSGGIWTTSWSCGQVGQCFADDNDGSNDESNNAYASTTSTDGVYQYNHNKYTSSNLPTLSYPKIDESYLQSNLLTKSTPRMILTSSVKYQLLTGLKSDYVLQNMQKGLERFATYILNNTSVVERVMNGKRMLAVSRTLLYRMNVLCMYYILSSTKDSTVLSRINNEILAACNFSDWNPSHFLDTAEMGMGIALAIDWLAGDLPSSTVELAKSSLIEKVITPTYDNSCCWMTCNSNWNQVCHGGLIAAAIATADVNTELAASTIQRSMKCLPYGLAVYGPDGNYPEGATYWEYGTSYTILTADILTTALGSDFGITSVSGFRESAMFRALCKAPSGKYYNFSDCGDTVSNDGDLVLSWFAPDNALFFERQKFLRNYSAMNKPSNLVGVGIIWLSRYDGDIDFTQLPSSWKGDGATPVVFFTSTSSNQYYFGGKGGKGGNSHGNIDAGSFVFELNGVRWVVDPGSQNYNALEQGGIDLWNMDQDSSRWDLLTKNNFGHSTLTVNQALHDVSGLATIINYDSSTPSATIDMTAVFGGTMTKAYRTFTKDSSSSLLIEDSLVLSDSAESVTWQLMTTASVEVTSSGAILTQDSQTLTLTLVSSPSAVTASVVSLYPPPHSLDRQIEGLKRIEFYFSASAFSSGSGTIQVQLSG